ncbi:hypothetical protein T12_6302 [Trichinella patagoniensis]|uniref:Uncharacterized protein n=1 Tax=Trichinella patagoniensis TaxID=990121 RepID=A0A0V0ZX83_9BILA|nr:hypothetical protein T12_6302 [Trichinella patagoniensis]
MKFPVDEGEWKASYYQDSLVITDYMDFRKYFPTAEFLDEVVQKTIRLVDVVGTLMLFQERGVLNYVITTMCSGDAQLLNNQVIQYEFSCVLVPVIPVAVITDLNNRASVNPLCEVLTNSVLIRCICSNETVMFVIVE